MSDSPSWHFTERLTNEEFSLLLPYLSMENVFLTQVFVPRKKWLRLVDANFQTFSFMCGACTKQVKFENFNRHFKSKQHYNNLRSNITQLYHPFFTYGKADVKLARGEQVAQKDREVALKEVNGQIRSFSRDASTAKHFAEVVQRREQKSVDDFLVNLGLETKIDKPEQMFVKVTLPFEDLPELLFCATGDKWQQVITWKTFTRKAAFTCNICTVHCSGIESVNSHLNGYTHKCKQLIVKALHYEKSSKVTKNCSIQIVDSLSISIHENAKCYFKNELERWQQPESSDDESNGDNEFLIPILPNTVSAKVTTLEELVKKIIKKADNLIDRKNERTTFWGHIGVEYVLCVKRHEEDASPTYECGLCEILGSDEKIQRHLLNFEHIKKYLDLHYADTMRKYETIMGHMKYAEFRAVMGEIVRRVAIEIEKHHGRSLPCNVSFQDYKNKRPELIAQVYGLLHASQNHGPSFSNVVSKHDIENIKKSFIESGEVGRITSWNINQGIVFATTPSEKVYLRQISHDPLIRMREYNAKMNKGRGRSASPPVYDRCSSPHRRQSSRSRTISPKRTAGGAFNIWDIYRRELANAATQIEHTYEGYRRNPESHPQYEQEWNEFWQRRKLDLERDGVNHRTYNFQPEWVQFFKQRIEQLFGEALHKSQITIRRKLDIPLDAEEDDSSRHEVDRYHRQRSEYSPNRISYPREEEYKGHVPSKRQRDDDYSNVLVNKRQTTEQSRHGEERFTVSSIAGDSVHGWGQSAAPAEIANISDNHSNLVHVLRLMTALEEHLGSLGGKVMDLLAKALQLEKNFHGSIVEFEAKILTPATCNLLETAMEKLKGILFAGLLDDKKVGGFNRVIQYTTELLKYAEKMGWRQIAFMTEEQAPKLMSDMQRKHSNRQQAIPNEKSLTDTLMDLMNESSVGGPEDMVACPPPPVIRMTTTGSSYTSKNEQITTGSSLANFSTQLSIPRQHQHQHRLGGSGGGGGNDMSKLLTRSGPMMTSNSGGNNLSNNNFNNNVGMNTNNTRCNLGPSGGPRGGSMQYNNPSAGSMSSGGGSRLPLTNKSIPQIGQANHVSYLGPMGSRPTNQGGWGSWNKKN